MVAKQQLRLLRDSQERKKIISSILDRLSFKIIGLVILLIGLPLAVFVAQKPQEIRQRASSGTTIFISPSTSSMTVGQSMAFDIYVDPGTNVIGTVKLEINYDPAKLNENEIFVARNIASQYRSIPTNPGSIILEIDIDPTRAIQIQTHVVRITFVAQATADSTTISFGSQTQLLSLGTTETPGQNVLSTTNPATVQITEDASATPTLVITPTPSLEPSPTVDPATPTTIPAPSLTASPTPEPTLIASVTPSPTDALPTTITPTPTLAVPTNTIAPTAPVALSPTPSQTTIIPDANGDGAVDILDFNIWKDEFTGVSPTKQTDFNQDGKVDLLDYNIWRNYLQP